MTVEYLRQIVENIAEQLVKKHKIEVKIEEFDNIYLHPSVNIEGVNFIGQVELSKADKQDPYAFLPVISLFGSPSISLEQLVQVIEQRKGLELIEAYENHEKTRQALCELINTFEEE